MKIYLVSDTVTPPMSVLTPVNQMGCVFKVSKEAGIRQIHRNLDCPWAQDCYLTEWELVKGCKKYPVIPSASQVLKLLKKVAKITTYGKNLPMQLGFSDGSDISWEQCPSMLIRTRRYSWGIIQSLGNLIGTTLIADILKNMEYDIIPRPIDINGEPDENNIEYIVMNVAKIRMVKVYRFINGIEVENMTIEKKEYL